MSVHFSKFLRVLLLAPILALILLATCRIFKPHIFVTDWSFLMAILTLVVLPLLSYPLSIILPKVKEKGRDGQRKLAIIFSMAGYVIGFCLCFLITTSQELKVMFLTYLLSASLIGLFTFVIKLKASGHACGMMGPIAYLSYFVSPWCLTLMFGLIFIYWPAIKLKRHNIFELILGTVFPVIAMFISIAIFM